MVAVWWLSRNEPTRPRTIRCPITLCDLGRPRALAVPELETLTQNVITKLRVAPRLGLVGRARGR